MSHILSWEVAMVFFASVLRCISWKYIAKLQFIYPSNSVLWGLVFSRNPEIPVCQHICLSPFRLIFLLKYTVLKCYLPQFSHSWRNMNLGSNFQAYSSATSAACAIKILVIKLDMFLVLSPMQYCQIQWNCSLIQVFYNSPNNIHFTQF